MDTDRPPEGITPEEWAATPQAVQHLLLATLSVVALLQQHLATLTQRVAELEAQLKLNSHNSSKPPSSDPPSAPTRPARTPRGRKAGGQVGHVPHERPTPEPDQITAVEHHYPSTCPTCGDSVSTHHRDVCAPSYGGPNVKHNL